LLNGEWVQRERRIRDARSQLTKAAPLFDDIGSAP
jgi:hypothetical protein